MSSRLARTFLLVLAAGALLAGCERPPIDTVQRGFRGTGMEQVYNPRILASEQALNTVPASPPPASPDGPKAGQVYQNVKVLGDLSVGEFARHMVSITSWVSPKEGCAYCHNAQNFADDSLYTKVVARRMLQMTQTINSQWKTHVAETGVTCYTCHRGKAVPDYVWFKPPQEASRMVGGKRGQNTPVSVTTMASLPYDAFTPYLLGGEEIRVASTSALPTGVVLDSTQGTESTYSLMMHMSDSLGVNCTYCHNSRNFGSWETSTPQRITAWHGIRMARQINNDYLVPLTGTFPPNRLGPTGDVAKLNCGTCHQGAYKPLNGQSMLKAHPELAGVTATVSPAPAPAPAAAAPEAPAAAPAAIGPAIVYFGVGATAVPADAGAALAPLVEALKADPAAKVSLSGFHSASGTLAQNQELAKKRAFAVRDALVAAGITADRVVFEKPQQTEANVAGEDATSRRVEASLMR